MLVLSDWVAKFLTTLIVKLAPLVFDAWFAARRRDAEMTKERPSADAIATTDEFDAAAAKSSGLPKRA